MLTNLKLVEFLKVSIVHFNVSSYYYFQTALMGFMFTFRTVQDIDLMNIVSNSRSCWISVNLNTTANLVLMEL